MSWKDILVVSNSPDRGAVCVQAAADLAYRHNAGLRVLVPTMVPDIIGWGDFPVSPDLLERALAEVKKEGERTVKAFADVIAASPAKGQPAVIEANSADFRATIAEAAQLSDLVVVAQPTSKAPQSEDIMDAVLFASGRPVLMIPTDHPDHARKFGSRILVAWKPGREASRALHDALPALQRADAVRLFTGSSEESVGAAEYAARLERLSHHLAHHGVRLADEDQRPSPRGLGILEAARIWGADMIVMGAYGHSRLQETVFGGATREAIAHAIVPVLLSH